MPRYYESYFKENSESLALGYLSSYLRQHGFRVIIFDASIEDLSLRDAKEKILNLAQEYEPLLIGFTIADMTFIESTIETIKFLKSKGVNSHFTMDGHSPTFNYKEIFKLCPELDSVVRFEGEDALLRLVQKIKNNEEWKNLPNIAFQENGKIKANLPLDLIKNLDNLPFSSRDYTSYVLSSLNDTGIVPLAASRGCYKNCGFCSIRNFYGLPKGKLWRERSIKSIIEEIVFLKKVFPNLNEIVIVDDVFTGPHPNNIKRMYKFRDELKKHNIKIMFSIADRVDNIDDEIGELWYDIGVRQALLGFESSSMDILNKFNKGITLENQRMALDIVEKYNIDNAIAFINFTPWSTLEQIEKNVRYFLSLKVNMIQGMLNRFQIYDGTPLAIEIKNKGLIYGYYPNMNYRSPDERVDKLYEIINNSFNPYLFLAYSLKILERELRMALFNSEIYRDKENIVRIKEYRKMYKRMMQKIMGEASSDFLKLLELIKNSVRIDEEFIVNYKESILRKSNEWFRTVMWFRSFCPVL